VSREVREAEGGVDRPLELNIEREKGEPEVRFSNKIRLNSLITGLYNSMQASSHLTTCKKLIFVLCTFGNNF